MLTVNVVNTIEKIYRVFSKEEVLKIFNALQGSTSLIFVEFILNPREKFTTPQLMERLNISDKSAYRSMKRLRDLNLIRYAGATDYRERKFKRDDKGTWRSGGPDAVYYHLNPELIK